ncbi:MAG TPA: FecR domain-containing protein [Gammaproteobacteria bacterium]
MPLIRSLAGILLLAVLLSTATADDAVVHAVQPPAWIERAGGIVALRPGDPLLAGDVIRTGPGGRVQVDLPEGSRVKLGEDVQFRTERMRESSDSAGGFFDAAFNVLKGAFRFTTGLAGGERRRDVTFRVGVVTAGIRGTDIWGKSADDGSDMVLVLEGKVELGMPGHDPMMMSQPAHGVMMMPSGEMRLMDAMPASMLQQYARETEMNDARAMMMMSGEWQLIVMSLRNGAVAADVGRRLVTAGYPAEILDVTIGGVDWHRVALTHLASAKDARMQGEALVGQFGVEDFWIRRD